MTDVDIRWQIYKVAQRDVSVHTEDSQSGFAFASSVALFLTKTEGLLFPS